MNATAIDGRWKLHDYMNVIRVRLSFRRNTYRVDPGLYSLGSPDENSQIFVTANYKYTFNVVRRALEGIDCYLLILDTKGINVWCAAGKGTFGTEQIIHQIENTGLSSIVKHRKLIVPQLGAPGINPSEVRKTTGFNIIYGPVEACDLKLFITKGYKADGYMRIKQFRIPERFAVSVTHFMQGLAASSAIAAVMSVADFLVHRIIDLNYLKLVILNASLAAGALFTGSIVTGLLLPVLPGRAFTVKGLTPALIFSSAVFYMNFSSTSSGMNLILVSKMIILSSWIIYQALNLTGSSTFTSLTGVRREIKYSIPVLIICLTAGLILFITGGVIL